MTQHSNTSSQQGLGFQAIAGDAKVQLLPQGWPADRLPPPSSSLLAVASQKGLVAAAGPDRVVIASTKAVRDAYQSPNSGPLKPFEAQFALPVPARLSHLCFSADEEHLILSPEQEGGLIVYSVAQLTLNHTQPLYTLSTDPGRLHTILPNPTPEKAELVLFITANGCLSIVNLKTQQFHNGPLVEGASAVAWSNKGKQLVTGMADGSCVQLTPEGHRKANLPAMPGLTNVHVSAISWLENDIFLVVYTSNNSSGLPESSVYQIITRQKGSDNLVYQQLPEPSPPFGLDRIPSYQFLQRLRDFPPDLSDAIIVASTASSDVGLISRATLPLTKDFPSEQVTNVFTTTTLAEDSRRALLPMTASFKETSPIGMALDLSAQEPVRRPLPKEEYEQSQGPLPALMLLNNDGVLSTWWFVYADSIRQNTCYPGLSCAGSAQKGSLSSTSFSQANAPVFGSASNAPHTSNAPVFGSASNAPHTSNAPIFGSASNAPGFGNTSNTPVFGSTSNAAGFGHASFGSTSNMGQKGSLWGSGSTPSQTSQAPAFGSASPLGSSSMPGQGPAFGSAGALGIRASPWASAGSGINSSPASTGGGFASFAQGSGFAASKPGESVLSKPAPPKTSVEPPMFGSSASNTSSNTFQLGTTFKADTSEEKSMSTDNGVFGSGFSLALQDSQRDADMDIGLDSQSLTSTQNQQPSLAPQTQKPSQESTGNGKSDALQHRDAEEAAKITLSEDEKTPNKAHSESTQTGRAGPPQPSPSAGSPLPPDSTSKTAFETGNSSEASPSQVQSQQILRVDDVQADTVESEYVKVEPSGTQADKEQPEKDEKVEPFNIQADTVESGPDDSRSRENFHEEGDSTTGTRNDAEVPTGNPSLLEPDQNQETPNRDQQISDQKHKQILDYTVGPSSQNQDEQSQEDQTVEGDSEASDESESSIDNTVEETSIKNEPLSPGASLFDSPVPLPSSSVRRTVVPVPEEVPSPSLAEGRHQARERKRARAAREGQELQVNDVDEQMRRLLLSPPEPTRSLDPFVAHQDYTGIVDKTGIPGQIEKIFRDINSMVDTLGLNARSLACFVAGHSISSSVGYAQLDQPQGWAFDDLEDLGDIREALQGDLEAKTVREIEPDWPSVQKQMTRLSARTRDLEALIDRKNGVEQALQAPLSLDQKVQLRELRKAHSQYQTRLAEAEKSLMEFRAKLAVSPSNEGPTVQAVEKTITKMTSMARQKNETLDRLETELGRLGLGSRPLLMRSQREGSLSPSDFKRLTLSASPKRASPARESPGRMKFESSEEDVRRYRQEKQRRQEVVEAIRQVLGDEKRGIKHRHLE